MYFHIFCGNRRKSSFSVNYVPGKSFHPATFFLFISSYPENFAAGNTLKLPTKCFAASNKYYHPPNTFSNTFVIIGKILEKPTREPIADVENRLNIFQRSKEM